MNKQTVYVRELLDKLDRAGMNYEYNGDKDTALVGFSSLSAYRNGTLTWIKKAANYDRYVASADTIPICCAVVEKGEPIDLPCMIVSENSKAVFFLLLHEFWGNKQMTGIGEGTVISRDVSLGKDVAIGCNCTITGNITIGDETIIEHNVVIQGNVSIGRRCHIQSGAVIGIDGFGYSQEPVTKKKTMIEHFGGVRIGDDVFIGSHVNISRGTIDDTIIEDGVKIAASTFIAHNIRIGKDSTLVNSTLCGSATIGERAYISNSTVANQMSVGNDTVIGMGAVVTKPIGDNVIAYGTPARIIRRNDSGL